MTRPPDPSPKIPRGWMGVGDSLRAILAAEHARGNHSGAPVLYCAGCYATAQATPVLLFPPRGEPRVRIVKAPFPDLQGWPEYDVHRAVAGRPNALGEALGAIRFTDVKTWRFHPYTCVTISSAEQSEIDAWSPAPEGRP